LHSNIVSEQGLFSKLGADDDYNMELTNPAKPGLTANNPNSLHMEFDSEETIDKFKSSWWTGFHSAVDSNHGEPGGLASQRIDGHDAVAFGLFGLDCAHSCGSELHPVMGLAIRVENPATLNDTWAIFVRNRGNEGFCSSGDEFVTLPTISFFLPAPDQSVESVKLDYADFQTQKAVAGPGGGSKVITQYGVKGTQVWFNMPVWTTGDFSDGVLQLTWGQDHAMGSTSGSAARLKPPPSVAGEYPETRIEMLLANMTPRQRRIYDRFSPRVATTPASVVPRPATAEPPTVKRLGVTRPPPPAPDPALQSYRRAQQNALLRAYGGKLPPYIRFYRVKAGDTLWEIASKYRLKWQDIFELNRERIRHPNLIFPGQVFAFP
jgi:hypothetical protein